MANMSTIDPARGRVQISVTPDCKEEVLALIKYLKEEERINVSKEKYM